MPEEEHEHETVTRGGLPRKLMKKWREERGFTQMSLASKIGATLGTVAGIEQGRQEPSLRTAKRIADALDVDIDQIIWPEEANPFPSRAARGKSEAAA